MYVFSVRLSRCFPSVRRSYETIRKYASELKDTFDLLVCDEGHRWVTAREIRDGLLGHA